MKIIIEGLKTKGLEIRDEDNGREKREVGTRNKNRKIRNDTWEQS